MKQKSTRYILGTLGITLLLILLINGIAQFVPFRIDLTEEKRYSLHPSSIEILQSLEEPLEVEILLSGNLPGGMRRLQRAIEETIKTFNSYSSEKISFYYEDPLSLPEGEQKEYIFTLAEYGINPTNLFVTEDGERKSRMIFPGVVVRDAAYETGALVLKGEQGMSPDQILNNSIENLEFELIQAIKKLLRKQQYAVGILMGHGELDEEDGFGIVEALVDDHEVYKVPLEQAKSVDDLNPFQVLIISGPKEAYTQREIYLLDQFLMRGGHLIFLLDALAYSMAEAGGEGTLAMPFEHGLDQLLFRYGIRINNDFIQDLNYGYYPVIAGKFGDQDQLVPLPWPFYIAAGRMAKHPITKGLDQVMFRFASTMDTVKADGVTKTPLIFGSELSRKLAAPVRIALQDMSKEPELEEFNLQKLPLLYLLEGNFTSFFKNRFLPEGMDNNNFKESGNTGKVLVASTGNLFKSSISVVDKTPLPLGKDPFQEIQYANRQLLQNAVNYLLEPEGVIASRTKQFQIRPLNKFKVKEEKSKWQILNIVLPLAFFGLLALVWIMFKQKTYGKIR